MNTNSFNSMASRGSVDISSPYENIVRCCCHSPAQSVVSIFSRTARMAGPSASDCDTQYASCLPTTCDSSATRPSTRLDRTLHLVLVGRADGSMSAGFALFFAAAAIAGDACEALDPSKRPTYDCIFAPSDEVFGATEATPGISEESMPAGYLCSIAARNPSKLISRLRTIDMPSRTGITTCSRSGWSWTHWLKLRIASPKPRRAGCASKWLSTYGYPLYSTLSHTITPDAERSLRSKMISTYCRYSALLASMNTRSNSPVKAGSVSNAGPTAMS